MKFGFVTCVQLGLSCIEKIYEIGGELEVLITLHDHKAKNKSGRIYLDDFAVHHNLPLLKINHVNDIEVIEAIKKHDLDWLFIIGWSQIASVQVINAPKKGCIGMHPTLLPEGRGRASVPWAIIKGLGKTGVSMFILDEGVDTGPVLGQHVIPLEEKETATELYKKVEKAHEILMENVYPFLRDDIYEVQEQDESRATYWEGRTPKDGLLDVKMDVNTVDRLVRACTKPYPGAYLIINNIKRVIWAGFITNNGNEPNVVKFKDGFYKITDFEDIEV